MIFSQVSDRTSLVKVYVGAWFLWVISFVYESSFPTVHPRGRFAFIVQSSGVFVVCLSH